MRPVLLRVMLARLHGMVRRMVRMPLRGLGVMGRLLVVTALVMLRGFAMVLGGLLVMLGGLVVMFRALMTLGFSPRCCAPVRSKRLQTVGS